MVKVDLSLYGDNCPVVRRRDYKLAECLFIGRRRPVRRDLEGPWSTLSRLFKSKWSREKVHYVENTSLNKFVGFEMFTFFFQKHTAPKATWLISHINRSWVICFTQFEEKIDRCSSSRDSLQSIHSPIHSIPSNILLRSPSAHSYIAF